MFTDTERFDWYFGSSDKLPFVETYLKGMIEKWTPNQWRAAIDAEMVKEARV